MRQVFVKKMPLTSRPYAFREHTEYHIVIMMLALWLCGYWEGVGIMMMWALSWYGIVMWKLSWYGHYHDMAYMMWTLLWWEYCKDVGIIMICALSWYGAKMYILSWYGYFLMWALGCEYHHDMVSWYDYYHNEALWREHYYDMALWWEHYHEVTL